MSAKAARDKKCVSRKTSTGVYVALSSAERKAAKTATSSKKASIEFLSRAGITTAKGNLKKAYKE